MYGYVDQNPYTLAGNPFKKLKALHKKINPLTVAKKITAVHKTAAKKVTALHKKHNPINRFKKVVALHKKVFKATHPLGVKLLAARKAKKQAAQSQDYVEQDNYQDASHETYDSPTYNTQPWADSGGGYSEDDYYGENEYYDEGVEDSYDAAYADEENMMEPYTGYDDVDYQENEINEDEGLGFAWFAPLIQAVGKGIKKVVDNKKVKKAAKQLEDEAKRAVSSKPVQRDQYGNIRRPMLRKPPMSTQTMLMLGGAAALGVILLTRKR